MPVGASIIIVVKFLALFFLGVHGAIAGNICEMNHQNRTEKMDMEEFLSANGFEVSKDTSRQFTMYFDTPEFLLLNAGHSLRFLGVEYHSKKLKQKFHESIELVSDGKQEGRFPVKHYKNVKSLEGKHPLFFLVKRKEREQFSEQLKGLGVKYPLRVKEVFHASAIIHRTSIGYEGSIIGSTAEHEMLVRVHQEETPLTLLEYQLDHELLKLLPPDQQKMVLRYADRLQCDNKTEYQVVFSRMKDEVPFFQLRLAHPYLVNLLYVFMLVVVGVLVLSVPFWCRNQAQR